MKEKQEWDAFVARLRHHRIGEGVKDHITADPLFTVQGKRTIYGLESDYALGTVWLDRSAGDTLEFDTLTEYFESLNGEVEEAVEACAISEHDCTFTELHEDDQEDVLRILGHEIERTGTYEYWEHVNSHFTKEAAEAFIQRKKHDYDELRIYVESQVYCWEFNDIVEGILAGRIGFIEKEKP